MEVKHLNEDNLSRLGKLQNYLTENFDINVKKVLPKQKLEQAYQNVEKRLVNLRNKSNKFQQDPNYGMNIMVRDALGIMINEGLLTSQKQLNRKTRLYTQHIKMQ